MNAVNPFPIPLAIIATKYDEFQVPFYFFFFEWDFRNKFSAITEWFTWKEIFHFCSLLFSFFLKINSIIWGTELLSRLFPQFETLMLRLPLSAKVNLSKNPRDTCDSSVLLSLKSFLVYLPSSISQRRESNQ